MDPKKASKKIQYSESLIIIVYICSVVLSMGAAFYFSSLFFHYDLSETNPIHYLIALSILIFFCLFSFYTGRTLYKKGRDEFYTTTISIVLSITIPVGIAELVWSRSIPPWPAIELHGVDPEIGRNAWGRIQSLNPEATGNNSWGQRDNERTIDPPAGKTRIAFIGDSFLEESSVTPVSLLVESSLPPSFEIINLGVSATDPIDYYWRLKNVALKLGIKHAFVFIYMGNDLLENKPVDSRGITSSLFAPPPKSSLLGTLTPALNYHLAKKFKRSTNVWLAYNLHSREQAVLKQFREINFDKLPLILANSESLKGGKECYGALSKLDLHNFYQMLTHPDMGLFRTYILIDAITNFCHPLENTENRPPIKTGSYTLRMIKLMRELARKNGIGFSVVIVPQGFDVDDRMWSQWKILTDFRERYKYTLMASNFKKSLLENNIHVVDLYPALKAIKGTYLNVDGHWSESGNEQAAKTLVPEIMNLDIN